MSKKHNVVSLVLLFSAPLVAALVVYFGSDYFALTPKSNGTLINPPLSLEKMELVHLDQTSVNKDEFTKKWWLIYVAPTHCTDNCVIQVGKLRSVQLALNKNISRVKRLLLLQPESLTAQELQLAQEDTQLTIDKINNPTYLLNSCPDTQDAGIFIMDTLGNIMLCYNTAQEPHLILKDLEKLLKASSIG